MMRTDGHLMDSIAKGNTVPSSGEDKGRARRAQHDQFFYLKLFFSMPIMDDKMPILRGAF